MKIIHNKIIPFGKYKAITLWPFIFTKDSLNEIDINHENIHGKQLLELLIIFFYLIYVVEWIFKGYRNISFEREAYINERNLDYLKSRKHFAWLKLM